MGSNQSNQEDKNDDYEGNMNNDRNKTWSNSHSHSHLLKRVLEQEPEMLPLNSPASPLSPQPSSLGTTPRHGPTTKMWDPQDDGTVTEVILISHGECGLNLRPDLISGRCPQALLTSKGKRQARAMAVLLKNQGIRFTSVYSSPLDRARSTAVSVCKEVDFPEEQIQSSDALTDMSQGNWEGHLCSEIYTPEVLSIIDKCQPDFTAPSGESLRQVQFRMIHFLNKTVLGLSEKLALDFSLHHNENQSFSQHNLRILTNSIDLQDGPSLHENQVDLVNSRRLTRKKSGKSRLQVVTTTGNEIEDEHSPSEVNGQSFLRNSSFRSNATSSSCIGVFSHSLPIKCLLTGLLGCSPLMSNMICIDESSVTVLQHSLRTGWQIKRLNDTAYLRLL